MSNVQVETKKWWKSKIFWFGALLVLTTGSNYFTGWVSNLGVTPEQIQVVTDTSDDLKNIIERVQNGEKLLSMMGTIFGAVISITRVWFTDSIIPQSLKSK